MWRKKTKYAGIFPTRVGNIVFPHLRKEIIIIIIIKHPIIIEHPPFVSAMARILLYAKVAPPITLERKRFGYKQHANCSNCRGARENAPPIGAICHAFLSCGQ